MAGNLKRERLVIGMSHRKSTLSVRYDCSKSRKLLSAQVNILGRHFVCMISPSPPRVRLFSVTESVVLTPHPTAVHHMPEAYNRPEPSLLPIERPRCPKCHGRMMLARIEPGPNGSDLQTFECPKCEHVHKMPAEDPMKSGNAGWTNSGLKPPR